MNDEWAKRLKDFATAKNGRSVRINRIGTIFDDNPIASDLLYEVIIHQGAGEIAVVINRLIEQDIAELNQLLDWIERGGTIDLYKLSIVRRFRLEGV